MTHAAIHVVAVAVDTQPGAVVSKVVHRDEISNVTVFGFDAGHDLTDHRAVRSGVRPRSSPGDCGSTPMRGGLPVVRLPHDHAHLSCNPPRTGRAESMKAATTTCPLQTARSPDGRLWECDGTARRSPRRWRPPRPISSGDVRISYGKWKRNGWSGTGYLVAREITSDLKGTVLRGRLGPPSLLHAH